MLRPIHCAVILSLALTSVTQAQAPAFDVSKLTLGRDSLGITLTQNGQERVLGSAWDELTLGPEDQLRRIYRMENVIFGPLLDTVVLDPGSFRLSARRTVGRVNSDSLAVTHDTVYGWQQVQTGPKQPLALYLPSGVIDANAFDLAIRVTDWAPGVSKTWQAFLPSQSGIVPLAAYFDGTELVHQRNGQEVAAWRIVGDFAGSPVTFWVDPRTRALVKESLGLSHGAAMVFLR